MGLDTNGISDLASAKGVFTLATNVAGPAVAGLIGRFNVVIGGSGWTGSIALQESYDNGATWIPSTTNGGGIAAVTAPGAFIAMNYEPGVLHRLVPNISGATAPCRLSAGPVL